MAQGSYLLSGGRFVQGGSQRLSSALARAIRMAGGEVLVRRVVTGIALDPQGRASTVTHTAKDGSDPQSRRKPADRQQRRAGGARAVDAGGRGGKA